MKKHVYHWTKKDKWIYAGALLPFLVVFIWSIYMLGTISIYLPAVFVTLYILGNVFQAGACTGCPYRGKYCPPIFGVYLGNILSMVLYKNKEIDMKFIKRHAKIAEVIVYFTLLFPVYWLYILNWYYPLIYGALVIIHVALFMPTQCEKCSYNEVCPGGIAWKKCQGFLF